jgi:hypothetical protein
VSSFSPFPRFPLCSSARPNQKASLFIGRKPLGADEFFFEVFQVLVIQSKSPL